MKSLLRIIFLFLAIIILFLVFTKYFEIDKLILKRLYPNAYLDYVEEVSQKYDVDKNLIFAIIKNESDFNNSISSNKGAHGLMQIMETTALEVSKTIGISNLDLSDPKINIELGTKYYSSLYNKYKNNELALAAYNAGSGNVDKWVKERKLEADGSNIENIPFKETNMYVRKVLQAQKIYKYIYE